MISNNSSSSDCDVASSINYLKCKHEKSIVLFHSNAQSIPAHIPIFRELFQESDVDVIAVSESWLTKFDPTHCYSIINYNIFRKDRLNKTCGGVAVYVKKEYKASIIASSPAKYNFLPEYLFVEVNIKNQKLLVVCMYRPPDTGKFHDFLIDYSIYSTTYDHICILGDLNINLNVDNTAKKLLCDMLIDVNMSIVPIINTHHFNTGSSTIDIISIPSKITAIESGKLHVPEISKHDLIYVVYPLATL